MTLQQIQDRLALKDLVDTFSNLADEKRIAEQLSLFTENAQVTTYIGGELFADMHGREEIGTVFTQFLADFYTVYHLNGQHTVTFKSELEADAINYCQVILVQENAGKQIAHHHSVRYQDQYQKLEGVWLISKRVAHFMVSEVREI